MKDKIEVLTKISKYLEKSKSADSLIEFSLNEINSKLRKLKQQFEFINDWGFPESVSHICSGANWFTGPRTNEEFVSFINFSDPNYSIGCPDDGNQPSKEWLMHIRFATGAYVIAKHYPKEIFNQMFEELKTFNPKHVDTANNSLYFPLGPDHKETVQVFLELENIVEKYTRIDQDSRKDERIAELRKEIEKLGG